MSRLYVQYFGRSLTICRGLSREDENTKTASRDHLDQNKAVPHQAKTFVLTDTGNLNVKMIFKTKANDMINQKTSRLRVIRNFSEHSVKTTIKISSSQRFGLLCLGPVHYLTLISFFLLLAKVL